MRNAFRVAILLVAIVGCRSATSPVDLSTAADVRAFRVATIGCGLAADRTGSAVAVGDGLVVTVAHLVVQADGVIVSTGDKEQTAEVIAVDRSLDLALLRVPINGVVPPAPAAMEPGESGLIIGAANSGTVPFEVIAAVSLSIEEVLGTDRHNRLGYELDAVTRTGDSGAGAYDDDGRLLGIVFAVSEDGTSTWITAVAEVERFMRAASIVGRPLVCDPASSQLVEP